VSIESLKNVFMNYNFEINRGHLENDLALARNEAIFSKNYIKYIKLYKSIINDSQ
jgi:hypothetical protein